MNLLSPDRKWVGGTLAVLHLVVLGIVVIGTLLAESSASKEVGEDILGYTMWLLYSALPERGLSGLGARSWSQRPQGIPRTADPGPVNALSFVMVILSRGVRTI